MGEVTLSFLLTYAHTPRRLWQKEPGQFHLQRANVIKAAKWSGGLGLERPKQFPTMLTDHLRQPWN